MATTYYFPLPGWHGAIQLHHGTDMGASDLMADRGWPIVAIAGGRVTYAGLDILGGYNVMVTGDDGLTYYYAHMDSTPAVKSGDSVAAGDRLGVVGDSGDAKGTGTHLHIGIGYGIASGGLDNPHGGAGNAFDAVSFLKEIYAGATSVDVSGNGGKTQGEGVSLPVVGGVKDTITNAASGTLLAALTSFFGAFSKLLGR